MMDRKQSAPGSLSRRAVLAGAPLLFSRAASANPKLKVAIFSKHLQFLAGDDLAQAAADLGFDGIDITVRKGGHVQPERVEQDLPPLVATIRKHGLEVPMITVDIVDTTTPHTEAILKTMAALKIANYRWGGFKYEGSQPFAVQLEQMKPRIAKLAALNARYQVCAMYHTHSGIGLVGAPIWDLHILLKDLDPKAVGVNYDIGHATVEGGFGGWIDSFRITGAHLRGIAVKDFLWEKNAKGEWREQWKPLGEGMVHFPQFFGMVAEAGFSGPLQLHFEYPLGGADGGKTKLTIPREEVLNAMKRDLGKLRGYLAQANI
ncbi:MAG TPA: TIM barrel protein [Bryobacteraceae bacterium]